jgi:protein-tyrosine-phosphatase
LAEGILASKPARQIQKVDSAGTGSWHIDHKPDERSIAVVKKILIFQIKKDDNSINLILMLLIIFM